MVFNFSGVENTVFFEPKSWWKYDIYWLLKCFCFELFGDGKCGPFWGKKLMERLYLLVTEKFLFWAFPWWKMWSFLRQKVNGKMIFTDYWKVLVLGYRKVLVLSFSLIGNTVFFSQKVDVKVIFTWSFWAFHDIPGPGKYGFSCSGCLANGYMYALYKHLRHKNS